MREQGVFYGRPPSCARCCGANFTGACLSLADLRGARLDGADFSEADLCQRRHDGPFPVKGSGAAVDA
ncbi:pentapeptide repeat-containing protein [Synechococcus sp. CCY 0621]|uniref:pentapeptide repeat-containing protein n=1 Tax=Synechococcus sp. CCY 0621 TaxID=2815603 RepID=UPI001C22A3A9|nr:pentapeptide repeat-containing protein [Synechococcus sp. CCY 0621]